jgi:hypothetical protein
MNDDGSKVDFEFEIEDFLDYPHECPSQSSLFKIGFCIYCGEEHGKHAINNFCEVGAQSKADLMGVRWPAWNVSNQTSDCDCGDLFPTPLELAFHRAMVHDEEELNDVELAVLAARAGIRP